MGPPSPDDGRLPVTASDAFDLATRMLRSDRRDMPPGDVEKPRRIFDLTKALLEKNGHEIVESRLGDGFIETTHAIYRALEDGVAPDYTEMRVTLLNAADKGKNFAVHAEHLSDEAESHVEKQLRSNLVRDKGLRSVLATNAREMENSIVEMERGPTVLITDGGPSGGGRTIVSRTLQAVIKWAIIIGLSVWARDRGISFLIVVAYLFGIAPLTTPIRSTSDSARQFVAAIFVFVGAIGIAVSPSSLLSIAVFCVLVQIATFFVTPLTRSLLSTRARVLAIFQQSTPRT